MVTCYRLRLNFPSDERFRLTQQLHWSAVSVPATIAEGKGKGTPNKFAHFLSIASSSLTEGDTHVVIANELEYITNEELGAVVEIVEEVARMITGLRKTLSI